MAEDINIGAAHSADIGVRNASWAPFLTSLLVHGSHADDIHVLIICKTTASIPLMMIICDVPEPPLRRCMALMTANFTAGVEAVKMILSRT